MNIKDLTAIGILDRILLPTSHSFWSLIMMPLLLVKISLSQIALAFL